MLFVKRTLLFENSGSNCSLQCCKLHYVKPAGLKCVRVYFTYTLIWKLMTQKSSGKVVFHLGKYYLEIPVSNNVTNVVTVNTYNKELVKIQTMQVIHVYDIGDDE